MGLVMALGKKPLRRIFRPVVALILIAWFAVGNCEESTTLGVLPVFSRDLYETRLAHMIKFMQEQRITSHQYNDICTYMSSLAQGEFDLYIINQAILAQLDLQRYQLIFRSSENLSVYVLHKKSHDTKQNWTIEDLSGEVVYLPSPLTDTSQAFYHHLKTNYPGLLEKVKPIHSSVSHDRSLLRWIRSDARTAVTGSSAFRQLNETFVAQLDVIPIKTEAPLVQVVAATELGKQRIDRIKQALLQMNSIPAVKRELQLLNVGELIPVDIPTAEYLASQAKIHNADLYPKGC